MNYHKLLARLGVSGAHPGGFEETVKTLRRYPPAAGSRVLEVGCGTGQTACHLARLGCDVTALDIQPVCVLDREMVLKHPADQTQCKPVMAYYQLQQLLTAAGWISALRSGGFEDARVLELHSMPKPRMLQATPSESMDWSILGDPDVQSMLSVNDRMLKQYRNLLGYAVFQGTK